MLKNTPQIPQVAQPLATFWYAKMTAA